MPAFPYANLLIAVGDFQSVIQVVASGVAYANVHTTAHPGGGIRGRIRATHDEDDELPGAR
ncbi:MAG TPA: CHRD domain-containing protein [Candidatus Angelobacter sp.]|nr:CHRD domain-containing protein [Candidatus Angelobacter sp.]